MPTLRLEINNISKEMYDYIQLKIDELNNNSNLKMPANWDDLSIDVEGQDSKMLLGVLSSILAFAGAHDNPQELKIYKK